LYSIFAGKSDPGIPGLLLALGAGAGILFGIFFFVLGTIVCAQGQILLAGLDSAVNNSPLLDNSQRATIMSLSATR
ncbi:MAG: hypothetical protein WAN65_07625, partial [Candidatus Sulfotelmatobacter sp.]